MPDACCTRRTLCKTERFDGKSQHKSLTMVELMFLRGVRHENVTHVGAVRHFYYYQPPLKKSITSDSQLALRQQRSCCKAESSSLVSAVRKDSSHLANAGA